MKALVVAIREELKRPHRASTKTFPVKDTDIIIDCFPDSCPCCEQSDIDVHDGPYYRHQVFDIPKPTVDITEYRLFSGQCRHCKAVKAQKPDDASQGIIGPNLLSYIGVLAGQYHLSVRKINLFSKNSLAQPFQLARSALKRKSLQC
ncbi:hypothetical protein [Vibrio rumoiensis]|uniref:hypothetical protein n=1 Tax=Vibrio rumoiensis TaxID=76258 RepID=UPI0038CD84DB